MTCFRLNYYYFHRKLSMDVLINPDHTKRISAPVQILIVSDPGNMKFADVSNTKCFSKRRTCIKF